MFRYGNTGATTTGKTYLQMTFAIDLHLGCAQRFAIIQIMCIFPIFHYTGLKASFREEVQGYLYSTVLLVGGSTY